MTTNALPKRYECRWPDQEQSQADRTESHFWVDHHPSEPHWPDSGVMRWDLRQHDWHEIWPELIDHPCALLFAPRHPSRPGAPRFGDWVASWPINFKWEQELPEHLHAAVMKAKNEQSKSMASHENIGQMQVPEPTFAQSAKTVTPSTIKAEEVIEQLAVILLNAPDDLRPIIGQHLSTLAMAPDSGRTIQALKLHFKW